MNGVAWAQAAAGGGSPPALLNFIPLVMVGVVFYFLLFRPQQQKNKERQTTLANLRRNDRVLTAGGLHGRIAELTQDVVTLEIATNVRVRVARDHIDAVVNTPAANGKGKAKGKN